MKAAKYISAGIAGCALWALLVNFAPLTEQAGAILSFTGGAVIGAVTFMMYTTD